MIEFLKTRLSLFLAVVLVASSMSMAVLAAPGETEEKTESADADVTLSEVKTYGSASGTCGEDQTWELDDEGTLTIRGTGTVSLWNDDSLYDQQDSVKKIILSEGITEIESWGFSDCSSLVSVSIPDSVTRIGNGAFCGCKALTSVTIPDGVTQLYYWVFEGCSALQEIVLPEGLLSLESYALANCTALTEITIPASVKEINACAFTGSSNLTSVKIDEENPWFCSKDGMIYNKDETEIVLCLPGKTGKAVVSESVKNIGASAFYGCSGLTEIELPSQLNSMSGSAFAGCTKLTSITVPSKVTAIAYNAFAGCSSLKKVVLPSSLTEIKESAFANCTGLTEITLPSGLKTIASGAFFGCSKLETVKIPSKTETIGGGAFRACKNLKSISLPASLRTIGNGAFVNCTGLTGLQIPKNVSSIGRNIIVGCTGLKKLEVDTDNQYYCVQGGILYNKKKTCILAALPGISGKLVLPDTVTEIMYSAFGGCSKLTEVVLPAGLTEIGETAFDSCSSLKSVRITGKRPEAEYQGNKEYSAKFTVYYPKGSTGYDDFPWSYLNCKEYTPVSKVTLNKTTASLYTGSSLTLKATVSPSDAAYKTVTWSSSNTKIATVSSNGVVKGLLPGTVTITAKTDNGKKATCKVTVKLATPKLGKVTSAGYNKVKVTWSKVTGATGYYVYRKNGSNWKLVKTITSGSTVSFTDSKLNCGQTYTYTVRAYRKSGSSIVKSGYNSAGISGKPVLSAPVLKSVSKASNTSLKVTWGKVSGANGYVIYRKTANGSFKKVKTITKGTTVSWTDTGLKKGTKYTYTVKAYRTVNKKNVYSTYNKTGLARTLK